MNRYSIGMMQGRLTPMRGRGIQFFPFENWENEFFLAKDIGIDEIEWIFDWENYEDNPIWSQKGRNHIIEIIKRSKVVVRSICFDYFMRRPFYKEDSANRSEIHCENVEMLEIVIRAAEQIGAQLIEIPMVDHSSIQNETEKKDAINFMKQIAKIAAEHHIYLGLETDLPPDTFKNLMQDINEENVVANYDSGNSSGLGYDHEEELLSLGEYVYNVHIKDRVYKGTTVKLGTGSADFGKVFSSLKKIGYQGSIILQAARGTEEKEADNISLQKDFVMNYLDKYGLI